MIPLKIETLLEGRVVEHDRVEYKTGWNPNDIIHSICAFANDYDNSNGGYIVIGVKEEKGMPVFPLAGVQKEEKTNLVTTGIYSISRNPAFLGFDLMYIGILFSFFNWFLCFATGFAVVFFHLQIVNVEEDFLIKAFGNEYLQYKSKVCRYLGRKR